MGGSSVTLRTRELPSGRKSLVLSYYESEGPGKWKQKIESTGEILTGDKKHDTAAWDRAREREKAERRLLARRMGTGSLDELGNIPFAEEMERQIQEKPTEGTKATYRHALKYWVEFAGPDIQCKKINRQTIEGFRKHLEEAGLHPNSQRHYLASIKAALAQAVRDSLIDANPASYLRLKRVPRTPTYLSLEEVGQLARTPMPDVHIRNAFFFELATGMRISDIRALTWSKVRDNVITFTQKKTGAPEILPLSPSAVEILQEQNKLTGGGREVFVLPPTATIDRKLLDWGERAKLEKRISTHVARHTFAAIAIEAGVDLYRVGKLLGHANIGTTQIYASVSDKAKIAAVAMLPRLDLGGGQ